MDTMLARPTSTSAGSQERRIVELDGWRALSISLVLAGHLLPLGPKAWALNGAAAAAGMAIFFSLSGFLITQLLLDRPQVRPFLIRRLFRIVPLAWAAMTFLAVTHLAGSGQVLANMFFVANLPPAQLMQGGNHLWSLCLEVQFYMGVALLVAVFGSRGLYVLPALCVMVTLNRIAGEAPISIFTLERVDEILAGATVALWMREAQLRTVLSRAPLYTAPALLALLFASAHEALPALNYARPYIAGAMLAVSLVVLPPMMRRCFASRPAAYLAEVSFALYVVHGVLVDTWLASGATVEKYLKRPLLFAATFALAHLSTTRFERRMISLGKELLKKPREAPVA